MFLAPLFFLCGLFWILAGYQLDYVFDWTIMKYPQFRDKSKLQVCTHVIHFQVPALH